MDVSSTETESRKRIKLFDVPIDLIEKDSLIIQIERMIESGGSHYIMPINPIKIVATQKNEEFKRIIVNANIVFPDAVGVRWALRILYGIRLRNTPGIDLMQDVLQLASRKGYRVYLLGTKQEIIEKALSIFSRSYSGVNFVGFNDGYFRDEERTEILRKIMDTKPHILLVGMGVFRQEKFIFETLAQGAIPFCMGVGGSFDVIAGAAPRAPDWLSALGFEWLYRLIRQPKRIKPMMALPKFAILVLKEKLSKRLTY